MSWRTAHARVGTLLIVATLAACQGVGPSPSAASAAPSPTASGSIATTAIGTRSASPTTNPSPSASGVPCPDALPTALTAADLADPACYGTTELTLSGWLGEGPIFIDYNEPVLGWTISIAELSPRAPTAGEWIYDYLMTGSLGGVSVIARPGSGVDLSGAGRWATVRGHFNDPEVLACKLVVEDTYPDEYARPDCPRLFLATAVEPLDHAAPTCPTQSPIALAAFLAADARCFLGRNVRISGWEDVGEGFGGVAPVWPVIVDHDLVSAKAQFVTQRWESQLDKVAVFPWLVRGSGVRFDAPDRRVVVTGQIGHALSDGCRPADIGWAIVPPVSWAQTQCRHLFVITKVTSVG